MISRRCEVKPIGVIHTEFKSVAGTPIQPAVSNGAEGCIEILPEFVEGLQDLDGCERIWLIFWLDRSSGYKMKVVPFRDTTERGLFSTRAPRRPNPIGISVVRLEKIESNTLFVRDIDIVDGTPLLDIKPYVPEFDSFPDSKCGWLDSAANDRRNADSRFEENDDSKEFER